MKEIKLLETWTERVIGEKFTPAQAPSRMGTPMKGRADRPLPRQADIQYKAQRAHPELSPEQALALYMSDELVDKQKMDMAQNKLINKVKNDNDRLRRTIDELGRELQDHEAQAARTDQEVERLKSLSGKLKPAGEIQQQAAKASADKIEAMLGEVEKLKQVPGMDEKKFKEIAATVDKLKSNPALDDKALAHIQSKIEKLETTHLDDKLFNQVMAELEDTKSKLDAKESRFKDYINKKGDEIRTSSESHAQEMQKYSAIVDKYKKEIEEFSDYMKDVKQEVAQDMKVLDMAMPKIKQQLVAQGQAPQTQQQAQATDTSNVLPFRAGPKGLDQLDAQDEREHSLAMHAGLAESLEKFKTVNPNYYEWGTKYTPVILRMFYNRFPESKDEYAEEQIVDQIHDMMPFLWDEETVTKKKMDNFLDVVAHQLRKEGKQPVQQNLPGFGALSESYESMLDQLINLPYVK